MRKRLAALVAAAALFWAGPDPGAQLRREPCWRQTGEATVVSAQPETGKFVVRAGDLPEMELTVPRGALIYDAATGRALTIKAIREGDRIEAAFLTQAAGNIVGQVVVHPRSE